MTTVLSPRKSVAVNPLKLSSPLGASLAFLGLKGTVPLFHGSQGCTAFAKVILVRHFREAIPLATTAMTEVSTILGGEENIEQAILTLVEKANPEMICLLTTGLTETRGDDMQGILRTFRQKHPELDSLPIIFVSTPDYKGSLQDGYAAAIAETVAVEFASEGVNNTLLPGQTQVTILAGPSLSPGDVEEVKEMVREFGLTPLCLPDLSGSLDGHLDDDFNPITPGGTSLEQLRQLGESCFTLAIGNSMEKAAQRLQERFGTEYQVFPRLSGLAGVDDFLWRLARITLLENVPRSFESVPEKYRRQRKQLQDAILDTHFFFGRKRISLALEPDLLYQTCWLLKDMGAEIQAAVTPTNSPLLNDLPVDSVTIGDLEDFEDLAAGSDLLIANSHGKAIAKRLGVPLYRMGYPIFDRFGNGARCLVGYRGTMEFLFDLGNIFIDAEEERVHHFHSQSHH
ncbi:MAG: nitrogenase iron-molybdenum cofactor biosynthesis protein NifN [Spirulina sp.]